MSYFLVLALLFASCFAHVEITPPKLVPSQNVYDELKTISNVVVVEFYSEYCGSCKEFAEEWTKLIENKYFHKRIQWAKVNIDTPIGMAIAQAEGALDGGIPHVRMLDTVNHHVVLMTGNQMRTAEEIEHAIRNKLKYYPTAAAMGPWIKAGHSLPGVAHREFEL